MDTLELTAGPETGSSPSAPSLPRPNAPPIDRRFLFIRVAGLRARQLHRGARPRLDPTVAHALESATPERVAVEEVRRGLVPFTLLPPTAIDGDRDRIEC